MARHRKPGTVPAPARVQVPVPVRVRVQVPVPVRVRVQVPVRVPAGCCSTAARIRRLLRHPRRS
jgi:hypothetical protein